MVDEYKDISKFEQLSFVIRYVGDNENELVICERFLFFLHLSLDASALSDHIKECLLKLKLNVTNCVGQSYDGASVMSGKFAGVQSIIRNSSPSAIYVHCMAHRLNLALVDIFLVLMIFSLL